jgi:ATP-dependent DNA helicase RecG
MERLIDELRALPKETEWVEFKVNKYEPPEVLGEYLSALANSACLHGKKKAYLVFGIQDETHRVVGTDFRPRKKKVGNEELENWLAHQLDPRNDFVIHETDYQSKRIVLFEIDAAQSRPVKFRGIAWVRVGSYKKKLADYPEKERKIWANPKHHDWSAGICRTATVDDLDEGAIVQARLEYKKKNPQLSGEIDGWDNPSFLNKAKICIDGKLTHTAIILLGKSEATHYLSPSVAQMSWILQSEDGIPKDYAHFGPPFLLNVEKVFAKIRNLNYRYLPDGTLFPTEITQYDPWVIREALHNCIAHQDYGLRGRIQVIEKPDRLIFTNMGSFIPGSVETVIERDAPSEVYRNPFLAQAMVNLNMIDTIGSGIKRMYQTQRTRYFPLPDYDLSDSARVEVRLSGKILDPNYTRLLIGQADLDLRTVILVDKVQKREPISRDDAQRLKREHLVEGRYPSIFVSAKVASITGDHVQYTKNRALDKKYYQDILIELLKRQKIGVDRKQINELLMTKLPDVLTAAQKATRIHNLLAEMSKGVGLIKNIGSRRSPLWVLLDSSQNNNKIHKTSNNDER